MKWLNFLKKETVANFTFILSGAHRPLQHLTVEQPLNKRSTFLGGIIIRCRRIHSTSKGAQNLASTVSETNKSSEEETVTERSFDKNVTCSSNNIHLFSIYETELFKIMRKSSSSITSMTQVTCELYFFSLFRLIK